MAPGFGLLKCRNSKFKNLITLTVLSREDVPYQGEDPVCSHFPIRTEGPIRGRQVNYLQYRLQTPSEGNNCGRFVYRKILTTTGKTTVNMVPEGREIPHLEIILDDIEDEIPMRSRYVLEDRRKVEKQNSYTTFHLFLYVLIRDHPVLTRFDEIDGPRLGDENDV